MNSENETKVIENSTEEMTENKTEEVTTEIPDAEKTSVESVKNEKEEKTTQEEFISEFAPEPIKIPNYNKEKEMRKRAKQKEKNKKLRSKKSRRRRKLIKKIYIVIRSIFLFVMLVAVATVAVATLYVKMNTSEYSVKQAIRDAEPETFVIGEIKRPEAIHLRESSKRASMADILRDNALFPIAYSDIAGTVARSTYPDFVAGITHEIINFYIYDTEYTGVTREKIEEAILENASHIKLVTDLEIGETATEEIARYIMKSSEMDSLSVSNIANQEASKYTNITSVVFSTWALICYVIALLIFMVLTIMLCKGYAYKLIGWATVLSGALCAVAGFFFKPAFSPNGEFIKSVFEAISESLSQNAFLFGGVTVLVGILIMLVGSAINEEDDDEYEEEYIDEIEQVSTAQ